MSWFDVGIMSLAEVVGDFAYKDFANNGGITSFSIGTIGYIGVVYALIRSLQGSQVLLVNAAWDGLSAIIESLAAMIFLGEYFENYLQYVGLLLIIIGLFCLKMPLFRKSKFVMPKLFTTTK